MSIDKSSDDGWFLDNLYQYDDMLRAWLKSRFPSRNDLDDVIQEAYLRVLKVKDSKNLRSPKAFLFATARNLTMDRIRHESIYRKESLTETNSLNVLDMEPDSFETIARDQELELLTRAVQQLPPRCRQIFTLRKVYGISQKEIARSLGISLNTVSAQLGIGIRKCTEYIEKYSD